MTQHDVVHCLLYHHLATKDFTQWGEINSKVAFLFFFQIEDISGYLLRTKIRGYRTSIYVSEKTEHCIWKWWHLGKHFNTLLSSKRTNLVNSSQPGISISVSKLSQVKHYCEGSFKLNSGLFCCWNTKKKNSYSRKHNVSLIGW